MTPMRLLLFLLLIPPVAETRAGPIVDTYRPEDVARWCVDLHEANRSLGWAVEPCPSGVRYKVLGHSVRGRPLVYAEFGDPHALNTSLILVAVHGDEITPVYVGLKTIQWLREREASLRGTRVVIAPLVNPDGFYALPRSRMNAHGVDVNRNFPTRDWEASALRAWRSKFHSDPRRFPGQAPRSEPETLFQEELIRQIHPQKILAIHAPLNFMDYDGPTALSLKQFPRQYVHECLKLRSRLRAITSGYFPGSLGNFAGHDHGIPTLTLELPTAEPAKAERYWQLFSHGIQTMVEFTVPPLASLRLPQ